MSPRLIECDLKAACKGKPVALKQGNVLILLRLDPPDACLVSSDRLFAASPVLKHECESALQPRADRDTPFPPSQATSNPGSTCGRTHIEYMLVLQDIDTQTGVVPQVKSVPLESTLEDAHIIVHGNSTVNQPHETTPEPANKEEHDTRPLAWRHAFELLLRMLLTGRNAIPKKRTATNALPVIQRVVEAASSIDALTTIAPVLHTLFLDYINKNELWEAIAIAPHEWLQIGIAFTSRAVFDEAFKHLVGAWSACVGPVPKDLLKNVNEKLIDHMENRASELYLSRMQIEHQLMRFTPESLTKASHTANRVGTGNNMLLCGSLWREWVRLHLDLLDGGSRIAPSKVRATVLCAHREGSCLSIAGLLTRLAQGTGFDTWDVEVSKIAKSMTRAEVQSLLNPFLQGAAKLVQHLAHSELLYQHKDKIDYLTCVKVTDADVPWLTARSEAPDMNEELEDDEEEMDLGDL